MKSDEMKKILGKNYDKLNDLCQKFGQALDENWSDRKYKSLNKELSKLLILIKEIMLKEDDDEDEINEILNGMTFTLTTKHISFPLQNFTSAVTPKGKGV